TVIEKQILGVLSPRYSENLWSIAMLLPWFALFPLTHTVSFELKGLELVFAQAIVMIFGLVLMLIAGVIIHPLSSMSIRRMQKTLPNQFQRRAAFKEPLIRN